MTYLFSSAKLERINLSSFVLGVIGIISSFLFYTKYDFSSKVEKVLSVDSIFSNEISKKIPTNSKKGPHSNQYMKHKYCYKVQSGDTFIKFLSNIGIKPSEIYNISKEINKVYDISNINVGQYITFLLSSSEGNNVKIGSIPHSIIIHINDKIIECTYNQQKKKYNLKILKQVVNNKSKVVSGFVKDSLYNSAVNAGAPHSVIMDYIKLLSHEINFKKDIWHGSEFRILFDYSENNLDGMISNGNILYAYLSLKGRKLEIYQYKDAKGKISYFYSDGADLKKAFLTQPIKKARISSGFGIRVHPISKSKKIHKGVDYAAKKGTPILATGDGVVELVKYGAGYGKYIFIRHSKQYSTLYAHMSHFRPGIKKGVYVKQGDVIGYVGSTGAATGAHLHYEVRRFGKPINPMKLTHKVNNRLEGVQFLAFKQQKKQIDKMINKRYSVMVANR